MARWSDYVLSRGEEVDAAWREAGEGRPSLYVIGEGFDPRMLVGLRHAAATHALGELTVLSLGLAEAGGDSERALMAAENVRQLTTMAEDQGWRYQRVPYPAVHERRSLGRALLRAMVGEALFTQAEHVVVDISALPTGVSFAVIGGLLDLVDSGGFQGELQIVVAENVEIDNLIEGEGAEDAPSPIVGFRFEVELDPGAERPLIVWAPVLGEGAGPQLEALEHRLVPDEICPVLPFPARNPRRPDDLLLGMRELLVDRFEVEPSNYIYAHETNPFDLYRALSRLHGRYRAALAPLGDARVVVSIHSSKTLSLGGLLAAHEHRLPVINAEPMHYHFDVDKVTNGMLGRSEIACLWLSGTPTA